MSKPRHRLMSNPTKSNERSLRRTTWYRSRGKHRMHGTKLASHDVELFKDAFIEYTKDWSREMCTPWRRDLYMSHSISSDWWSLTHLSTNFNDQTPMDVTYSPEKQCWHVQTSEVSNALLQSKYACKSMADSTPCELPVFSFQEEEFSQSPEVVFA